MTFSGVRSGVFLSVRLIIMVLGTSAWVWRSWLSRPRLDMADVEALGLSARRAADVIRAHQAAAGHWPTAVTPGLAFEHPGSEVNVFVPAVLVDPLMIQRGSRWLMGPGWSAEALFDLGESISPGEHSLEVRLTGGGATISVDVFERGRSGHRRVSS